MADKDYYKILGVAETAGAEDIKKTYRKMALKYHPDKNPGDKTAEEKFKKVSEAYYTLGDDKRRKEYDNLRKMGAYTGDFSSSQGFDFSDFARNFSGGGRGSRGSVFDDIFSDLMSGKSKGGSYSFYSGGQERPGYAGGGYDDDPGEGDVDSDIKAVLPIPSKLAERGGEASFKLSGGKNVNLKIPPGTKDGQKMRLKDQGSECPHCRHNGDLILTIKIKK